MKIKKKDDYDDETIRNTSEVKMKQKVLQWRDTIESAIKEIKDRKEQRKKERV